MSPITSRNIPAIGRRSTARNPTTPPNLIASAVAATKGNLTDKAAVQKALEKADFKSVRGDFKFGNNHVPIQNFYLQDVVKDAKGDLRAEDGRHHRQGQPGRFPLQVFDEVIRG